MLEASCFVYVGVCKFGDSNAVVPPVLQFDGLEIDQSWPRGLKFSIHRMIGEILAKILQRLPD